MLPDVEFEALQTSEGNSLLFSISSKNILYCTCEVPSDTHGWVRTDISATLSERDFSGQPIKVKSFDLGQDLSVGTIDLVMVVTDNNNHDWLYLALGNSDANWVNYTPNWQQVKFDDPNNMGYANDPINDVFVARFGSNQFIFADIVSNPQNQALSRYAIDPTGQVMLQSNGIKQCWIPHSISSTLQAGHISSAVGCGPGDESVYGIYTLYTIDGNPQLVYAPLFNENDPGGAPFPTDFDLKTNITAIDSTYMAMAVSKPSASSPDTDLFFASESVLYFCANGNQVNHNGVNPQFTSIYNNALFQNIQSLHISNWNQNIVLWGQSIDPIDNLTSRLFVMECLAGQETNPDAWSYPIPLLLNSANSTTYINNIYSAPTALDSNTGAYIHNSCNVIFAEQVTKDDSGNDQSSLVQLFQDPVTTAWQQRFLLMAPLDVTTEIFDNPTYSTHVEITDDNNNPQINVPVVIWASSPCSVYVNDASNNDAYFTLDPVKPLLLTTDITGNVTIMQQVDSIGGISYFVAVQNADKSQIYSEAINPITNTITRLNTAVPDGKSDHLTNVWVTGSDGTQTKLITGNYDTATASSNINTICQQNTTVNSDGLVSGQSWPSATAIAAALSSVQSFAENLNKSASLQSGKPVSPTIKRGLPQFDRRVRRVKDIHFNPQTDKIWGWTYGANANHYEGIDAVKALGITINPDGSLAYIPAVTSLGSGLHIEAKLGHIVKWMKSEAHKLETAVVTFANGVVDCMLTIAGDIYHFVAKCANDLAGLVHTVLNAIATALDDVIKWIGFLFDYNDILTTHKVTTNIMKVAIDHAANNMSALKADINQSFTTIVNDLNKLVGLPQLPDTQQSSSKQSPAPSSAKTPQAQWGTHKLKSNGQNTSCGSFTPDTMDDDKVGSLMTALQDFVNNEQATFAQLQTNFKSIIDNAQTLTVTQIMEQVLAAIADFFIDELKDLILALVDVIAALLVTAQHVMTAPINIPVISWLYGKISGGSTFTLLDLCCLVTAIPATIVYKLVENEAPFSQGNLAEQLYSAPDLATVQSILAQSLSSFQTGVDAHDGSDPLNNTAFDVATKVANISCMAGAVGTSVCTYLKSGVIDTLKDNTSLNTANTAFYMLYVWPDLMSSLSGNTTSSDWYVDFNNWCTWVCMGKVLTDGVAGFYGETAAWAMAWSGLSPWGDFVINTVWEAPTNAAFYYEYEAGFKNTDQLANGIINLIGGNFFDFSGMLSPVLAATQSNFTTPQGKLAITVAMAGITFLNLGWGTSCILDSYGPFKAQPS